MIKSLHHVEKIVHNLVQSEFYYRNALAFSQINRSANEADNFNSVSCRMQAGAAELVLSAPANHNSIYQPFLNSHGEGIKTIGLVVTDMYSVYNKAKSHDLEIIEQPGQILYFDQLIEACKIRFFGDVDHLVISAASLTEVSRDKKPSNIKGIDHIAICVNEGGIDEWVSKYCDIFDCQVCFLETVNTGKSGMKSKVIESSNGKVKLVFVEPLAPNVDSLIRDYIHINQGEGVHHIAFETHDIIQQVTHLRKMGVEFLQVPDKYYKIRKDELGLKDDIDDIIQRNQIMIDHDDHGKLLQIFSKPISNRHSYFFELIQREGAKYFGSNNVKSLFKAIEMDSDNVPSLLG